MGRILAGLALAALLVPGMAGQDKSNRLERFELFNACRPMVLVIEQPSPAAADIRLTKEALQAAAESRLRAARLYSENSEGSSGAYLSVAVTVSGQAFDVSLQYGKQVTDEFGLSTATGTWFNGTTGTHARRGRGLRCVVALPAPRQVPGRVPTRQPRRMRFPIRPALGVLESQYRRAPSQQIDAN